MMLWEFRGLRLVPFSFCLPHLLIDTPIPLLYHLKSGSNRFGAYFGTQGKADKFLELGPAYEKIFIHILLD